MTIKNYSKTGRRLRVVAAIGSLGIACDVMLPVQSYAVFAQVLEASCYLAERNLCKLETNRIRVNVNETVDERTDSIELRANGTVVWSYATDDVYSRKPSGDFSPPLPSQGIALQCGRTYQLTLVVKADRPQSEGSQVLAARSDPVVCPQRNADVLAGGNEPVNSAAPRQTRSGKSAEETSAPELPEGLEPAPKDPNEPSHQPDTKVPGDSTVNDAPGDPIMPGSHDVPQDPNEPDDPADPNEPDSLGGVVDPDNPVPGTSGPQIQ